MCPDVRISTYSIIPTQWKGNMCIFVWQVDPALFKSNGGCTCWPRRLMAQCPGLSHVSATHTRTHARARTHTHTRELAGEKCSYGPCSESRFAQAVCTGSAPNCSHSHCGWVQREEKNIEHFMEKVQIRRANCNRKKGKYCRAKCKEENAYTTEWRNRKEWRKKGSEVGEEAKRGMFGFILWPLISIMANLWLMDFHTAMKSLTTSPWHSFQSAGLIPVQGYGCLSAHTAGHGRQ